MSDVGGPERPEPAGGGEEPEEPPMVGSGGEDISAGIIVSSAGGRRLDAGRDPGHSDLDEIIDNSRTQPEHRAENG